ncbi:armadillo-type protein [Cantharellus anzutake]|uniref:armadillo-type protein n=1 Tax=Cantharellus anzutake TaxID=1750568 RepID=UPI00190364A0|nr:armadillo-type protein [Cantharellus anzutake]KAF8332636.1 armadillo-type protein [Cantharellus anzutake]
MEYLRTLGSAAATSLLQKSGITLPFSLGEKVSYYEGRSIWTLYDAISREGSSPISVFYFDGNSPSRKSFYPLARNALRKLRTIRHPDVLKFIGVVENDTTIYIMTERVRPLGVSLSALGDKSPTSKEEWLIWGLHRITIALAFINDSCQSTHGNLRTDSIFVSPSGEWRLGGFELLSNPSDEAAVLYQYGSLLPDLAPFTAPEVKQGGWSSTKDSPVSATDSYELGLFIHTIFNPTLPLPPTSIPPHPAPTTASRGLIPSSLFPSFKRLLSFLDIGTGTQMAEGSGFFSENKLVKICAGLDGFALSSEGDKANLIRSLKESADSFPVEFASHKVLPSLVTVLDHGGASANILLPLVLQLGKLVAPEEYSSIVLGPVVKLFATPDRGTRVALLEHLSEFVDKLNQKTVVEKIWPHLQTGFSDTVAVIREVTVRSIGSLAPHLSDRILNNELLRHLAKLQLDTEASIRTNTCILIGRLAPKLAVNTQKKVLVPAFTRAIKDNFVHARVAGVMALMATMQCYDMDDLAGKVIPAVSFALVDKEKLVRDQAFKAMELFLKKLEAHAQTMPESAISPDVPQNSNTTYSGPPTGQAALVNSAAGAATALAGWAMSSLNITLTGIEAQSAIAGARRPSASPLQNGQSGSATSVLSAPSGITSTNSPGPTAPSSIKAKALQLGASKHVTGTSSTSGVPLELERELARGKKDAWNDDLMDVHADADDWTEFESAPAPVDTGDAWGDMLESEVPTPTDVARLSLSPKATPDLSTSPTPKTNLLPPAAAPTVNQASKLAPSPLVPIATDWANDPPEPVPTTPPAVTSMAGMSKEEKTAEMARRREERKQRIAALKEQKKRVG